jgi:hypothetical protein
MQEVQLEILPQPDDTTCGPTCLQAVYRYWGDGITLSQVIEETPQLAGGGTLASLMGCHALARGYQARIYTFNLNVFDPTWFKPGAGPIEQKVLAQMEVKDNPKLHTASRGYLDFLRAGGEIRMEDLTRSLIRGYLNRSIPLLAGLSSTYLYRNAREFGPKCDADDVRGVPAGHFVVLCGYDRVEKEVLVADPYLPNPLAPKYNYYIVGVDRVVCAVLLGTYTYDANLLIIQPGGRRKGHGGGNPDRRQ